MDQLLFETDALQVVVLPEVGARLHSLRAFGHEVLRSPAEPETHLADPFFWGAYPMAPWCGRVEASPVELAGHRLALASNFPDGSAIHGQVYAAPWDRHEDGSLRIAAGGDAWPWKYEARLHLDVRDAAVRLDYSLTNRSDEPMPAGLGVHPWFLKPVHLAIHGDGLLSPNWATPAQPRPVSGPHDLRRLGAMPDDLDATWTNLADPPIELSWPDAGLRATMRALDMAPYAVAASPGHLDAIAVELQTHAPQGIRRLLNGEPGAMSVLEPGRALRLRIELAFERAATTAR